MSSQMCLCGKKLGEVLVHSSGYLTMLSATKRCEQTTIAFRILPNLLHPLAYALA
jgi:hypothetical protein